MATPGSSPSSNIDPCWHIDENAGIYSALSSQAYDDAQDESPQTPTASQTSQWSQGHNLPPRGKGTGAWNTPVSYTENSAQTFGFDVKKAAQRNKRLGQEMKRTTVGPMPVKVFLDTFFDTSSISFDSMPEPTNAFINVPAEPDKESDIYLLLIIALNAEGDRSSRCPGFTFRDTSNNADNSGGKVGAKKPDVCCYADHHLSLVETRSDNVNSLASRTDMGLAATYFEIKAKPSADVFSDPPNHADLDRATWQFVFKDLLKDALDEALEILGQHTAYASEIAMRQYRWCVYSIAMAGTIVRLMRWDRAGVIVTEAFDIHNHPEFLCRFLWCFAHASDTERGYDLTSTPAWPGDEPDFVARIKDHIKQQLPDVTSIKEKRKALGEHYAPDSVTSIFVLRSVQGIAVPYEYLVSRPMVAPLSMIGRGTRGYWAVDASTREVVFLKDTWRSGTREGTIMEELREGGVPIPPVEYHGDVPIGSITRESDGKVLHLNYGRSQTTMTQRFLGEAWVCGKNAEGGLQLDAVVRRTRYRLVSKFAGYPLTRIRGTAELLKGVYDAFQALRSAYERCKRLHRDVSPANIVLYHDGAQKSHECRQGYLIDWELSCDTSNSKQPPSASMSWQFRSIAAIVGMRTHCAAYKVQDDMESLYHVLVYCALLYLPHDLSPQRLLNRIQEYFDSSHVEGDEVKGGRGKLTDIQYGTLSDQVAWRSAEVSAWLCSVRPHLRDYGFLSVTNPEAAEGAWSPSRFALLWDNFFAKYPIAAAPNRDRFDHIEADRDGFVCFAPRSALGPPFQPTIACPSTASSSGTANTSAPTTGKTSDWWPGYSIVEPNARNRWRTPYNLTSPASSATSRPSLPTNTHASEPTYGSRPTRATIGLSSPFGDLWHAPAVESSNRTYRDTQKLFVEDEAEPLLTEDDGKTEERVGKRKPSPSGDDESKPRPKRARAPCFDGDGDTELT